MPYLLAIDQGTSSSRTIIFDHNTNQIAIAQKEFKQIYPQPGWVEHDPYEIWQCQLDTINNAIRIAGLTPKKINSLGITNQRETTIIWDKKTGHPIYNAIVWQDRRTASHCEDLRNNGFEEIIRKKTGLHLDPYFSATKIAWILDHIPNARKQAEHGKLAFGTIDSWLAWQLSAGKLHVTDITNASRTMLWNIHESKWDHELLNLFNIPVSILPEVYPSSYQFGRTAIFEDAIPINGIAGDQQSALFGQACFESGQAKNTYGTGCFCLMNTGTIAIDSKHGLISSATCQNGLTNQYALEGSVFIGGAVIQWLRDELKAIKTSSEIESLTTSVKDSDGVIFVPAFTGLGAPYWDADAKGAILGLNRNSSIAHIARAAVESIAYQTASLIKAMNLDSPTPIRELRVDGGAAKNQFLLQFQANLLGIPIHRPKNLETTALGAAFLAGITNSVYESQDECASKWKIEQSFYPKISKEQAYDQMSNWENAVKKVLYRPE